MSYRLVQGELSFKFAAAHFVLGETGCERLHGHNYLVEVQIYGEQDEAKNLVIDFLELKPFVRKFVEELDHKILLPTENPHLQITKKKNELFINFKPKNKNYIFPESDVCLLPIKNTTVEEFARLLSSNLIPLFMKYNNIDAIEVGVFEYKGQGCWMKRTRDSI
ncbi:MAG: 6-pyruvoyl tetrahydropterin synthase family protein [Candidatus Heimdallarchaeota archaeon]|nr:6-pyruvoyl tetrahydropterin synthase family protein [Candidatus Heimdallarchaeota archaeon]MBY8992986.1 6-pyruvoyl tetrahydropterin synthase family protein [Candidatus Heimdallarchaeota archaeon]